MLVIYGFAKVHGMQFATIESELDKPLREVSGFWLSWYFFGYSDVYRLSMAMAEITSGLLLTFRRTYVLGALLALPIMINVVLLNFVYRIGAYASALLILVLLVYILAPHAGRLWEGVVSKARTESALWWLPRFGIVLLAIGLNWWIAQRNTRAPTLIDGKWPTLRADSFEAVFFERNRAHLAVFKTRTGVYHEHHFELKDTAVYVWQTWLTRGPLLYRGTWSGDSITLRPSAGADTILLIRAQPLRVR